MIRLLFRGLYWLAVLVAAVPFIILRWVVRLVVKRLYVWLGWLVDRV